MNNIDRRFFLKTTAVVVSSVLFPALWTPRSFATESSVISLLDNTMYTDNGNTNLNDEIENYALNIFRATIIFGLGKIPVLGGLIASIVSILWPASAASLWDKIKEQVEKMIDQKIDQAVYIIVKNFLDGLGLNLKSYISSLQTKNPNVISENFVACHQLFIHDEPQFRSEERQEQLLPLYATFALLHLTLLRDAVLNASSMGWDKSTTDYYINVTKEKIKEYGDYIDTLYEKLQKINDTQAEQLPQSMRLTHVFFMKNEFRRKMQIAVLDTRYLFQYMDTEKYPTKVPVKMERVVYSWPIGNAKSQGHEVSYDIERTRKLQKPTSFSLYSGGGKDYGENLGYPGGVVGGTVRYQDGFGPNGNSNNFFGRYQNDDGHRYISNQTEDGPIVAVWYNRGTLKNYGYVKKGDAPDHNEYLNTNPEFLYTLRLEYENGKQSGIAGGCDGDRLPDSCIYIKDHILVDILEQGYQKDPGMVGCAIFGFQLKNCGQILNPEQMMYLDYVSSVDEPNIEDLEQVVSQYMNSIENSDNSDNSDNNLQYSQGGLASIIASEEHLSYWQSMRTIFWDNCEQAKLVLSH